MSALSRIRSQPGFSLSQRNTAAHTRGFFWLSLLREVEDQRIAESGEIHAQVDRGASTNKEQRSVIARMAPRIFDCEARFSHASQPMDRLTRAASQPPPQIGQCGVATFKERAKEL